MSTDARKSFGCNEERIPTVGGSPSTRGGFCEDGIELGYRDRGEY